ncbi:sulfurtransferase [Devriesea agamarum]|uniref:sulfurtransferase n=1 Tax=Devriesea agamarum TaxID=472569 RepID=UPI000A02574C|nr:sulfurtransferase [Devriesea agamarum]
MCAHTLDDGSVIANDGLVTANDGSGAADTVPGPWPSGTSLGLPPIIDRAGLDRLQREGSTRPLALVDIRFAIDGSTGRENYLAGHLPQAVYLDLDGALAAPASEAEGRHPLPDPQTFASALGAAGIGDDTVVVAYDDRQGSAAARLVWMLRALGHDAALLSGGFTAWDGPVESGEVTPVPAVLTPKPWPRERLATVEEVADGSACVLDARAPERYRGDTEPVDPRAGHIPGALNQPFAQSLDEDGCFLTPMGLREIFALGGLRPDREIIAYCGSGVTACHLMLALEQAGYERVRLFPGSWSQWSANPDLPVATGDQP